MPAYRSSAEAEIRNAVVERLREIIPGCRIIHEINAESFGNRIDVLAVGADRIAAVEIKSEKDKLARLPSQIKAMRRVTQNVFSALHEKFLSTLGGSSGVSAPDEARGSTVWIYPRAYRDGHVECRETWYGADRFAKPKNCLPPEALWILWRSELHVICAGADVRGVSKLTMEEAIDRIRWHMTGEQITTAICSTLRQRVCIEADPAPVANDNVPSAYNAAHQAA